MARLGKRERARRRSNTCNYSSNPAGICRGDNAGSSSAAAEKEMHANNTEIAVKKKMKISLPLLHTENLATAVALAGSDQQDNQEMIEINGEEGLLGMQQKRKKKKRRNIDENIALRKTEMAAQAVLHRAQRESISKEKLAKLPTIARGLAEGIEEMTDGLRAETCRLKRKVGRLQESKRALKKQVQEAQEALLQKHKELEERTLCMICHDRPRDTFILPCLHFLYCFSCLSKHSSSNNSCPSCRRSILGLCMASSLASPSTSSMCQ